MQRPFPLLTSEKFTTMMRFSRTAFMFWRLTSARSSARASSGGMSRGFTQMITSGGKAEHALGADRTHLTRDDVVRARLARNVVDDVGGGVHAVKTVSMRLQNHCRKAFPAYSGAVFDGSTRAFNAAI